MFNYSYIHCGKASYIPCENDEECSTRRCKENSCKLLNYNSYNIYESKELLTGEILILLIIPCIICCCCCCCKRRNKKDKFTKVQSN